MAEAARRRGGPLVALVGILGFWIVARIAIAGVGEPNVPDETRDPGPAAFVRLEPKIPAVPASHEAERTSESAFEEAVSEPLRSSVPSPARSAAVFQPMPLRPLQPVPITAVPVHMAASHQLMWMAALARMPLPAGLSAAANTPRVLAVPFYSAPLSRSGAKRWSADGWLLLRSGSGGALAPGAVPATYGASQAGAVLRYRLSPDSPYRPEVYARLATAIDAPGDKEVATGLSVRPIPALPLRVMAEMRLADQSGTVRMRPAAMVVTEVQPVQLPHRTRAEFYGQAGYVGGRYATPFADGQARIDTHLANLGPA